MDRPSRHTSSGTRLPVLLLAAGRGMRMGSGPAKLLREVAGRPLLAHALERIRDPRIGLVLVVVAPDAPGELLALVDDAQAEPVVAPRALEGMAWSLLAGLEHALTRNDGASGVLVALGDDPLALDDLPAVLDAVDADPSCVIAVDRATAPHPVWLPTAVARSFRPNPAQPDRGLAPLLRDARATRVAATTPSLDADTPAELLALSRALSAD